MDFLQVPMFINLSVYNFHFSTLQVVELEFCICHLHCDFWLVNICVVCDSAAIK